MTKHYITPGIHAMIPSWLQNMIWFMVESMDVSEKDSCQIFCLSDHDGMQKIEHSQKYPPYHNAIVLSSDGKTIRASVVILESENTLIMMLFDEYQGGFRIG